MLDDDRIAELSRALGHPTRVRLMRMLASQSECSGSEVFSELPLAQSTVSEHLRVLKDAGLLSARAVGPSMVYCVTTEHLGQLAEAIAHIANSTPSCTSAEKTGAC